MPHAAKICEWFGRTAGLTLATSKCMDFTCDMESYNYHLSNIGGVVLLWLSEQSGFAKHDKLHGTGVRGRERGRETARAY